MRTIIVGDVHGCYKTLDALLKKVKLNKKKDQLIFVGDYTDRGPESYKVTQLIRSLKEEMNERCVLLLGNHEDMMLKYFEEGYKTWVIPCNGGSDTKKDFNANNADVEDWAKWINKNSILFYEDERFRVVHAGFEDPDLNNNFEDTLLWDRNLIRSGDYSGKLTIIGHTPIHNPNLIFNRKSKKYEYDRIYEFPKLGLIDIDTGCVFNYSLTALIIKNNKIMFKKVDYKDAEVIDDNN